MLMPLRFSEELFQPAAKALGHINYLIVNTVYLIAFMSVALLSLRQFGATGLALAWVVGFPLAYIIVLSRYSKLFQFPLGTFVRSVGKIVSCGAIMVATVFLLKLYLTEINLINLFLLVGAGSVSYIISLLVLDRRTLVELKQAISSR